jgi:ParB family chromosome partitioning protein
MHKRGLGRGLDALLSSTPAAGETLTEVSVDQVEVNPRQPRRSFDPIALDELARSLKASGMLQPVIVRPTDSGGWQLIAGERRWRAARQAGLERIPAIVREASDAESLEIALVENLLREDLNPLEEAEGYQRILIEFGWTQGELAQRVGRDPSSIANSLRLLKLAEPIQQDLRDGRLTMGHARALLALDSVEEQLKLRDAILAQALSVRATEESVRTTQARSPQPRAPRPGRRRSPEIAALEDALQRALMTRVRVTGNDRRGRIEILYATADELERLSALLGARY